MSRKGTTGIRQWHSVQTSYLDSKRYWEKWNRVSAEQLEAIGKAFFQRIWERYKLNPECVLFDTTN